ncbi:hypothetical protein CJ030_MR8G022038 [Morella rubra]|uniref:Uncharacterized protein n=1 Tax=Morella rubra TaxID=262757 RepID=A0A6A1UQJ7_9ROSI|nr:hypothetical protein CJ030_MR8G022038 [Morella rubra]
MILPNCSVKIVVILNNMTLRTKDDVGAESTPGTLAASGPSLRDCNELLSPTTTSLVGTQSSYASTSGIRQGRGSDDNVLSMLSSHIGALVRQHVPFETSKWREVPDHVKSYVMNRVLMRSEINWENIAKLKIVHTSEARSFQCIKALLEKM